MWVLYKHKYENSMCDEYKVIYAGKPSLKQISKEVGCSEDKLSMIEYDWLYLEKTEEHPYYDVYLEKFNYRLGDERE